MHTHTHTHTPLSNSQQSAVRWELFCCIYMYSTVHRPVLALRRAIWWSTVHPIHLHSACLTVLSTYYRLYWWSARTQRPHTRRYRRSPNTTRATNSRRTSVTVGWHQHSSPGFRLSRASVEDAAHSIPDRNRNNISSIVYLGDYNDCRDGDYGLCARNRYCYNYTSPVV